MEKIATPLPRKQQIKKAFLQLAGADSTQMRDNLLCQLQSEDPQLADEVRALLQASEAGNVIEQICGLIPDPSLANTNISGSEPAPQTPARLLAGIGEKPGTVLGPYKLLEQIGEGGMGTVFHAQQTKPIRRKVALKIIKPGMDTGQVVARFEAERQALALMDHPNIAKVLDAGATEQGRPYFVMELVKGIPITDYCDREKLNTDQRLKLFIDVCHGVQHAHQKGIIHRDLKPSNILITLHDGKPVVKIIDFGIAKAIDQVLTKRTLFTQVSQMIGTPLYMSPEQAEVSGLDVDTRSDVYSLGVLLYELLTGTTPFDRESMKKIGIDEIRRMIRETEPPRPSQRLSTLKACAVATSGSTQSRDLKRSHLDLQGELDWIVMKALEKERDRRYESASAFAADMERYLSDEPVQACPPTLAYRLQKFTKRNRGLLTTGAIVVIALLAGTSFAALQAVRATAAEQLANEERLQSERSLDAALDAIEQLLKHVGNPELAEIPEFHTLREKILRDSLAFYERFAVDRRISPQVQFRVAGVFKLLGDSARDGDSSALGIESYAKGLAMADRLVQSEPDRTDYQRLQAELTFATGRLLLNISGIHDHLEQAVPYFEKAELLYRHLALVEPGNKTFPALQADAMLSLAEVYEYRGRPSDPLAVEYANRAYQLSERSIPSPWVLRMRARQAESTQPEYADDLYRQAIVLCRAQASRERLNRYRQAWLLDKAAVHLAQRHPQEAEALWKESLESLRTLMHEFPMVVYHSASLTVVAGNYAGDLKQRNREQEAHALLDDLVMKFPHLSGIHDLRAASMASGADPIVTLTAAIKEFPQQPGYWRHRGGQYGSRREFELALSDLQQAVELAPSNSEAYYCRGNVFSEMGRDEQADEDYEKVLRLDLNKEPLDPAFHYRLQTLAFGNSSVLANPALAARWALQAEERLLDDSSGTLTLGIALWMNKQLDQAVERFNRAIELDPSNDYAYHCRGCVFKDLGRYTDAIADLSKAIELNPRHAWSWHYRGDLSMHYFQRYQEALADFDMAIQLEPHPDFYTGRVNAYLELQQFDKALADLDTLSISSKAGQYYQHYQAALLSLQLGNLESYKARCLSIVKTTTSSDKPIAAYLTAWTCALAPSSLDDYADAIALGRAAVAAEPTNPQFLSGLGAILIRAGMSAEAKPFLDGIVSGPDNEHTSKTYTHYLLALTEHHLGNAEAARTHLSTANELADKELTGSIPWNRKLTIELLRTEAQTLIGDVEQ